MTVVSMTGFGTFDRTLGAVRINVQMRTVNHRYFEWKPRLPHLYFPFEDEIKKRVAKQILRGVVECSIRRDQTTEADTTFFDRTQIMKAAKELERLGTSLGVKRGDSAWMASLFRFPDWYRRSEKIETTISDKEQAAVVAAVEKCLVQLVQVRKREGKELEKHCRELLSSLEKEHRQLQTVVPELPRRSFERFKKKIESWQIEREGMSSRLDQELVLMAERGDVSEELTRLKSHFSSVGDLLSAAEPKGKKLDFYVQEIQREINTVGSKVAETTVAQSVVQMKSLVEQFREQVQNIE